MQSQCGRISLPQKPVSITLPFCFDQHSNNWMLQGFLKIKANGTKNYQKTFQLKFQIWVCQKRIQKPRYHFALTYCFHTLAKMQCLQCSHLSWMRFRNSHCGEFVKRVLSNLKVFPRPYRQKSLVVLQSFYLMSLVFYSLLFVTRYTFVTFMHI